MKITMSDLIKRLRAEVKYEELLPDFSNMTDMERLHHNAVECIVELEAGVTKITNAYGEAKVRVKNLETDLEDEKDVTDSLLDEVKRLQEDVVVAEADTTVNAVNSKSFNELSKKLSDQATLLDKQSTLILELKEQLQQGTDMGMAMAAVLSVTGLVRVPLSIYESMTAIDTQVHVSTNEETQEQSFYAGPENKTSIPDESS